MGLVADSHADFHGSSPQVRDGVFQQKTGTSREPPIASRGSIPFEGSMAQAHGVFSDFLISFPSDAKT
jgi:hypothetical protein